MTSADLGCVLTMSHCHRLEAVALLHLLYLAETFLNPTLYLLVCALHKSYCNIFVHLLSLLRLFFKHLVGFFNTYTQFSAFCKILDRHTSYL